MSLRTTLRSYQRKAVAAALKHDGFAFLLEQRTGKCLCSLAYIDAVKPDIIFIVCPKKALRVWSAEFKKHLEIDWKCYIRYVNFEAAANPRTDRKRYYRLRDKWDRQGKRVLMICDEAHRIRKRGGRHSKFIRTMGKKATYRLALTGTPIGKGHKDAWPIFDFIQPGVFGKWKEFEKEFLDIEWKENRKTGNLYPIYHGVKNEEKFAKIFHTYSFRKTLAEAQRDEGRTSTRIRFRKQMIELKPETWKIYRELEKFLEVEVRGKRVSTPLVLTLAMKLQQIAGGYLIQDERIPGKRKKNRTIIEVGNEKVKALEKALRPFHGRKIIICCRFLHEIERIGQILDSQGLTWKPVSGKAGYDGQFDTDAIILQTQSGEAIDLSASNVYIYFSWDYSLINSEQARFRVQSFDTEQVNYVFLIAQGTVDEDMYESVVKKKALATLICDRYRRRRERHKETSRGNQGRAIQAYS